MRLPTALGDFAFDTRNVLKFGRNAPRRSELIWLQASDLRHFLPYGVFDRDTRQGYDQNYASGRVVDVAWPSEHVVCLDDAMDTRFSKPLRLSDLNVEGGDMALAKYRACHEHWVNGKSWSETGIIDLLLDVIARDGRVDGACRNEADLLQRYGKLDAIFENVRRMGRLATRRDLNPKLKRDKGLLGFHIGPDGKTYWNQVKQHRYCIAQILNVPIPGILIYTHRSGLWHLSALRDRSRHIANTLGS